MPAPTWISRKGLATHASVGAALTLFFALLGASALVTFFAVYSVALAHEVGDGDLRRSAPGWPWNGVLDVAVFLPAPLLFLLWRTL